MRRYRILVLATFSVEKPMGGGQVVVSGLCKYLSEYFDIMALSLVGNVRKKETVVINGRFHNRIIGLSAKEAAALWRMEEKYGIGLSDYIHIEHIALADDFLEEFKKLSDWADLIIFAHPYLVYVLDIIRVDKKIIYHAIDVEQLQKGNLYSGFPALMDRVKAVEAKACWHADAIFTTCGNDGIALRKLYPDCTDWKKFLIVPNGIDVDRIPYISRRDHHEAKRKDDAVSNKTICVFVGSWHPPNLEALEFIINKLAPLDPDIEYIVIGSVKDFFYHNYRDKAVIAENVHLYGTLDEKNKFELYRLADFALNPMFSGSGTNVKMFEYMAAGLPVITTAIGARGIEEGEFTYFRESSDFPLVVAEAVSAVPSFTAARAFRNLNIVKERYAYPVIARDVMAFIYKELFEDYDAFIIDSLCDELSAMGVAEDMAISDSVAEEITSMMSPPDADNPTVQQQYNVNRDKSSIGIVGKTYFWVMKRLVELGRKNR